MNHPLFTDLRRRTDEAITFNQVKMARQCIAEGLDLAERQECLGELMYFRAQEAIMAHAWEEAMIFLGKALEFNPEDGAAYNDMALCCIETGDMAKVLPLFGQGIAVEPDYATIHHNKGWFLRQLGRLTEAEDALRQAIALDSQRAVTWENLANVQEAQGRLVDALQSYRTALTFIPASLLDIRHQIQEEIRRLEAEKPPSRTL